MQKSKTATIAIIIIMAIYCLLSSTGMLKQNIDLYIYVINPIFWIALSVFLRFAIGKTIDRKTNRKEIIQYCIIGVLVYIITYMVSGAFITFGKNPYAITFEGILTNLWILGVAIVAKEYIRYMLIKNVYDNDKKKIAIAVSIVYIFIDFNVFKMFTGNVGIIYIVEQIAQNLLPLITKNLMCSYISMNSSYIPSVIYLLGTKLYLWISPILPNAPWIMIAIIDAVIPIIIFVYIRYIKNKKDIFKSKEKLEATDPKSIIPLAIGIILVIWFAIGIFPIKPIAIATGSMEKELMVGDIAIIQKCNSNDVVVGDIIEYQMKDYTVIHRVVEKNQKNGEFYFITKGDNNDRPDELEVKENQLIGKVIFKVRYLGYPAIWLNIIKSEEVELKVET